MKPRLCNLSVWASDGSACIRIRGRANVGASHQFKSVLSLLRERGCCRLMVDLTECALMDSTFLGVLSGCIRQNLEKSAKHPPMALQIFNPNERVTEILDNLGVLHFFNVVQGPIPNQEQFTELPTPVSEPTRQEICQTSLQAHQTLMELNQANVAKFMDVTRFLAEDLKRSKRES